MALVESLFWLRQNLEHAQVLALYYRPEVQNDLLRQNRQHEQRLKEVYEEALAVNKARTGLDRLLRNGRKAVIEWQDYLKRLLTGVLSCNVPTGQINVWPVLDDHMIREAGYYLEMLDLLRTSSTGLS